MVVAAALVAAFFLGHPVCSAEPSPIRYLYTVASGAGVFDLESGEKEDTLVLVWATCTKSSCSHDVFVHWVKHEDDGTLNIIATTRITEFTGPGGPTVRRLHYDLTDDCYIFEVDDPSSKNSYRMWLWVRGIGKYEVFKRESTTG